MNKKYYKDLFVVIVGSTRYENEMRKTSLQLQCMGIATCYPECIITKIDNIFGIPLQHSKYPKSIEDGVSKNLNKSFNTVISKCDYVLVYNKDQYIGENTKGDICNAIINDKPILWLEKPTSETVESINNLAYTSHYCSQGIDYNSIEKLNFIWRISIDDDVSHKQIDTLETNSIICYGDPSIQYKIGVDQ